MRSIFHSIEAIQVLIEHLPRNSSAVRVIKNFCQVQRSPGSITVRYFSELAEAYKNAEPGAILFLAGNNFFGQSFEGWDVMNRFQLANFLRAKPELAVGTTNTRLHIKIIEHLYQLPYLLEDIRSGELKRRNEVVISLITSEDFMDD